MRVALKIIKPDLAYENPKMVEDFLNEANHTAKLDHRHVIKVKDADLAAENTVFMAMKYLRDQTFIVALSGAELCRSAA
jgi:serine/threonine protein kinase